MTKQAVSTARAPAAVGPYSQAVDIGSLVFISGQIPLRPETGDLVSSDIRSATRQVLQNIQAILQAAGLTMAEVVKCEVFLLNMSDFSAMNEVYSEFFTAEPRPARQAVGVAALPKGAIVEISCIAFRGK